MSDENATPVEDASEEAVESVVSEEVAGDKDESTEEVLKNGFVSDRQKAMDDIIQGRREELSEETDFDQDVTSEKEVKAPVFLDGDQWVTTVKVNGEEINVPFDTLKSSHQKDQASQKRFEEAAQYAKELKQREHYMNNYAQKLKAAEEHLKAQANNQPPQKGAEQEGVTDKSELVKKYHEALYEDDAVKAAELFNTLTMDGRQAATPNIEQAVDNALNRAIASRNEQQKQAMQMEYNSSLDEAVSWFNAEYEDIANTPELRAIADSKTVTLTQENPDWTPKQIIKEAAEYTREWLNKNSRPSSEPRFDRKKKIVKQPRSVSASSRSPDSDMPPQTATDIIDEMKRQRGQI